VNALRHAGLGDEALQLARSVQGAAQTDALSFIWHIRIGNLLWTRYHRPEEAASEFRAACRIKPADELANMGLFHTLIGSDVMSAFRHLAAYIMRRGKNSQEANVVLRGLISDMNACYVACCDREQRITIEGTLSSLSQEEIDSADPGGGDNWAVLNGVRLEFTFNGVFNIVWRQGGPVVWNEFVGRCEFLNEGEKSE